MKNWSGRTFKLMAFVISAAGVVCGVLARFLPFGISLDQGRMLYNISIILVFSAVIPGLIWMFKEE